MKRKKRQRGKGVSRWRHPSQGKPKSLGVSQFGPASHRTAPDSRWKETCISPAAMRVSNVIPHSSVWYNLEAWQR